MAKPYLEGKGWATRVRTKGYSRYFSGYPTAKKAQDAAAEFLLEIKRKGMPAKLGPHRTCLAVALQDYARERLPFHKGAAQEARRINAYLRACALPVVVLTKKPKPITGKCYFDVSFRDEPERAIPSSLREHREMQANRGKTTKRVQARLARKNFADITAVDIQELVDVMQKDGYEPATVHLERSLLRVVFNYARKIWRWAEPVINPATGITMPEIDNNRDRVVTNEEWARIVEALNHYPNPYVVPAFALLLETAMRCSEPLVHACWQDIDWSRCVLRLSDAKAGWREVPLNPQAISILERLQAIVPSCAPDASILPTTYEALKKAWRTSCQEAGVFGVNIHDLRHTAATRYSLEFNGDLPLLKVITGHKTIGQLMRYINVDSDDAVNRMHKRTYDDSNSPAGYVLHRETNTLPEESVVVTDDETQIAFAENVILVDFSRRAA